jgi:hypothetical protein
MNRHALAALALVPLALFLVVAASLSRPLPVSPARSEVERVQAHLAGAEDVLAQRDLTSLTPEQKRARAMHASRLKEYRERGVFPHNHDFRGERRPYFVDAHGVLCAMAHLISESGRDDIVRLVTPSRNNATVMELAADPVIGPVLAAWLDEAGLSVAEAQRIQPEYDGPIPFGDLVLEETGGVATGYAVASAALGGLNLTTSFLNFRSQGSVGSSGWSAYAGVFGGMLGIGLGGAMLAQDNESDDETLLGVSNAVLGTATAIAGFSAVHRAKKASIKVSQARHDAHRVAFAPTVHMGRAPGVGVSMRF